MINDSSERRQGRLVMHREAAANNNHRRYYPTLNEILVPNGSHNAGSMQPSTYVQKGRSGATTHDALCDVQTRGAKFG